MALRDPEVAGKLLVSEDWIGCVNGVAHAKRRESTAHTAKVDTGAWVMTIDTHPETGPQTEAENRTYVRGGELAKRLNVHPATVRRYGALGILPRLEIVPRSYLYDLEECLAIIEDKYRALTD